MAENVLLVFVYAVAVSALVLIHRQWPGAKSVEQYRREQRSEPPNIVGEGMDEARRMLKREKPRECQ